MFFNEKPTALMPGDVIFVDIENCLISVQRSCEVGVDGRIRWSGGDDKIPIFDSKNLTEIAMIMADIANLRVVATQEVKGGSKFTLG